MQCLALSAYIQRTHFPFMVSEPMISDENGLITAVWHFGDPNTAGMRKSKQCAGAAALIHSLSQVPDVLTAVSKPLMYLGKLINGEITLQLFLIGKGTDALSLTPSANQLLKTGSIKSSTSADDLRSFAIDSFSFATDPRIIQVIAYFKLLCIPLGLIYNDIILLQDMVNAAITSEAETMKKLGISSAACTTYPSSTVLRRYGFRVGPDTPACESCWQLSTMELAQAEVLELWRLAPFASAITHEQSRNRQFQIFNITGIISCLFSLLAAY